MTVFQRAASFAAITLCAIGLGAVSTPGLAFEADSPAAVASASIPDLLNLPNLVPVPESAPPMVVPSIPVPVSTISIPEPVEAELGYASLAAAVAAQDEPDEASAELSCLAGAIFYEAKGEPLAGQLAVAEVIMNRAKSGRFASSICSVVTQRGQFSFVRGGRIPSINPNRADYRIAMAVAQVALDDAWDSPASSAMFFHARHARPGWAKQRVASIGNHVFYR